MLRPIHICCLWLALLSGPAKAELHLWTLPVLDAEIMNQRIAGFIADLSHHSQHKIQLHISAEQKAIAGACSKIDIVIASYNRAVKQLEQSCQLIPIAFTNNRVALYSLSATNLRDVGKIGINNYSLAGEIARAELSERRYTQGLDFVELYNESSLVNALLKGEIDAFAAPGIAYRSLSANLKPRVKRLLTFKRHGHAVVLLSKSLFQTDTGQNIRRYILSNPLPSQKLFAQSFGLGLWYHQAKD